MHRLTMDRKRIADDTDSISVNSVGTFPHGIQSNQAVFKDAILEYVNLVSLAVRSFLCFTEVTVQNSRRR